MREFIDKTSTKSGTPLNRENLMAMQGFESKRIVFTQNSVVETNSKGETLTTIFNTDGSITETLVGEKTLIKTTTFNEAGGITEEVIE